jgi:hypothetical protein
VPSLFAGYKNVTHDVGGYMLNAVAPWVYKSIPLATHLHHSDKKLGLGTGGGDLPL